MVQRFLTEFEKERQQENIDLNSRKLWEYKQKPCADCKLRWHPYVMSFDHIDRRAATKNKNAKNLNAILNYNPVMFQRVLNGCSVVCRNCHLIRELRRDIDDPKVGKRNREEMAQLLMRCSKGALLDEVSDG